MKSNDDAKHFHSKAVLSCHSIDVLYTVLLMRQFDICILCAPLESAFIKRHTIIWTPYSYGSIVMIACHSKPVCKN